MSYCRWSSDDFRSDLYIYAGASGFSVNVALNRHDIHEDAFPPAQTFARTEVDQFIERHNQVMALVEEAPVVRIGLPHDGESRTFDSGEEAAEWVEELMALGYRVPAGVVDALREEDDS